MINNPVEEEGVGPPDDILTATRERGLQGGLESTARLFEPTVSREGFSLKNAVQDFIEFSPIGDVKDILSALDPRTELGPLERGLAMLPIWGSVAAVGSVATAAETMAAKRAEAARASLMADIDVEGDPLTVMPGEAPEWNPADPTKAIQTAEPTVREYGEDSVTINQRVSELGYGRLQEGMNITSYEDLAAYIHEEIGRGGADPDLRVEQELAGIGQRLAELGEFEIPENVDPDTHIFNLASWAVNGIAQAERMGILEVDAINSEKLAQRRKEWKKGEITLDDLMGVEARSESLLAHIGTSKGSGFAVEAVAQIAYRLLQYGIGPDLTGTPQYGVAKIAYTRDVAAGKPGDARIIFNVNPYLMPNARTIDAEQGVWVSEDGEAALDDKMWSVDLRTLLGQMGANHSVAAEVGKLQDQGRKRKMRRHQRLWYRRANKSIRRLAEGTGLDQRKIAATIVASSANTPWIPTNFIGAIHYIMTDIAGMDPTTPEYQQLAADVLRAGDWGRDIMLSPDVPTNKQYEWREQGETEIGAEELAVQHYSQAESAMVKGDRNAIRVMESTRDRVDAIWQGDIPLNVAFRSYKFGNFFSSLMGMVPTAYTMDVHQNRIAFGSMLMPKNKAMTMESNRRGKVEQREGYETEVPGADIKLSSADFDAAYDHAVAAGLDPERARAIVESARNNVPNEVSRQRYQLLVNMAQALYEQNSAWSAANQPQAETWLVAQTQSSRLRILAKRGKGVVDPETGERKKPKLKMGYADPERLATDSEYREAWEDNVFHSGVHDELDGNSMLVPHLSEITANASTDTSRLPPPSWFPKKPKTENRKSPSAPIMMEGMPDGTTRVWADLEHPGVVDALPHLTPLPSVEVAGRTMMIPRQPRKVLSVWDHVEAVMEDTHPDSGLPIPGEVRIFTGTEQFDPTAPGNRIVVQVDAASQVDSAVVAVGDDSRIPPKTSSLTGNTKVYGTSVITRDMLAKVKRSAMGSAEKSPFITHDWVAIAPTPIWTGSGADVAVKERLRQRLVGAVRKQFGVDEATAQEAVMEVEGTYEGDSEPSFVVFGLDYQAAAEIGVEFQQESIATRGGLIYTTGDQAGSMRTPKGGVFGARALRMKNRSVLDLGNGEQTAFSMNYDWDETQPVGDPRSLMAHGGKPAGSRFVVLDWGTGYVPWQDMDRVIREAEGIQGVQSVSVYADGNLWVPDGYHAVDEYAYTDGAVTGTVRAAHGKHYTSGHRRTVYVSDNELQGANHLPAGLVDGQRTRKQAQAIMKADAEAGTLRFDEDLLVEYPQAEELQLPENGDIFSTKSKIDGKRVQRALLDLNGPVPVIRPTSADVEGIQGSMAAPNEGEYGTGLVQIRKTGDGIVVATSDPNDYARAVTALEAGGYTVSQQVDQFNFHARRQMLNLKEDMLDLGLKPIDFEPDTPQQAATLAIVENDLERRIIESGAAVNGGVVIQAKSSMAEPVLRRAVNQVAAGFGLDPGSDLGKAFERSGLTLSPTLLGTAVRTLRFGVLPGRGHELARTYGNKARPGYRTDAGLSAGVQFDQRLYTIEELMGDDARRPDGWRESEYTTAHELGHVLHQAIEVHSGNMKLKDMWRQHLKDIERTRRSTAVDISGYAQSDQNEYFAELFANGVLNPEKLTPEENRLLRAMVSAANKIGEDLEVWYAGSGKPRTAWSGAVESTAAQVEAFTNALAEGGGGR